MTTPIYLMTGGCGSGKNGSIAAIGEGSFTKGLTKVLCTSFGLIVLDLAIFVTTLVIGILGALSIIHMPTAAWGILLGASGTVGSIWLVFLVSERCKIQNEEAPQSPFSKT